MRATKAALIAALFGTIGMTPCARADVSIKVNSDGVELSAHDATVEEVLASLEAVHDFDHRSSILLDRTISGTYKGTLRSVISRVLAAYDFVEIGSQDRFEVTILGLSGTKGQVGPQIVRPQPAPPQDANAQPAAAFEPSAKNQLAVPQATSAPAVSAASTAKPSAITSMLLSSAQASSGPPAPAKTFVPSMPSPADIATLTQKAVTQLDALVTSLQRLRP
jgi:RNase P/RNase MRP subunit POP5